MKLASADIGGTFTDLVYYDEDNNLMKVLKVHSTPRDQSIGLMEGLKELRINLSEIDAIIHGTTVATNSIIERKGAVCGLLTTKGFGDVLELRRRTRPHIYGLTGEFEPLIPRNLRLEVDERTLSDGTILREVNEEEVENRAKELMRKGAEVVVVSFLHSYVNPKNEKKAEEVLRRVWLNGFIVLSSEVLPEFREFERTSTAAANAYVQPVINRYLGSLKEALKDKGYKGDVLITQSNGGVASSAIALKLPINTFLSGPAAGVIAAAHIGKVSGFNKVISCDMGGTSFDVSLIDQGNPIYSTEKEISFGIPTKVPVIDITTIGAGGGSIAWIDRGGMLQVGPQSAGADPGPVCYGRGGQEPTITDANLVLGRIGNILPLGAEGAFELDVEAAKTCIKDKIGDPLELNVHEAALAIIKVANVNMAGAIRSVSIRRGYDPREFALVAFGGAGPMHANDLMKEVGLAKVIIPYVPGVASAIGCLMTDFRRDFVQTVNRPLDEIGLESINDILSKYSEQGKRELIDSGISFTKLVNRFELDMCYEGQLHVIRVPLDSLPSTKEGIEEAFNKAYIRRFFETLTGVKTRVVNLRCAVLGIRPKIDLKIALPDKAFPLTDSVKGTRPVYFDGVFHECAIYERSKMPPGETIYGPAIIEQRDSTVVIEPDSKVWIDPYYHLIMEAV